MCHVVKICFGVLEESSLTIKCILLYFMLQEKKNLKKWEYLAVVFVFKVNINAFICVLLIETLGIRVQTECRMYITALENTVVIFYFFYFTEWYLCWFWFHDRSPFRWNYTVYTNL